MAGRECLLRRGVRLAAVTLSVLILVGMGPWTAEGVGVGANYPNAVNLYPTCPHRNVRFHVLHKSGSMALTHICDAVAQASGTGLREHKSKKTYLMSVETIRKHSLASGVPPTHNRTNVFCVSRACPNPAEDADVSHSISDDECIILMLRDPRDQAISLYYGLGYTMGMSKKRLADPSSKPAKFVSQYRDTVSKMTLPEFLVSDVFKEEMSRRWAPCLAWDKQTDVTRTPATQSHLVLPYDIMVSHPETFIQLVAHYMRQPANIAADAYGHVRSRFDELSKVDTEEVNERIVSGKSTSHIRSPLGGEWRDLPADTLKALNAALRNEIDLYRAVRAEAKRRLRCQDAQGCSDSSP